jgi:hypothetical protein
MSLMSYLADMKVRAELGFVEKVQDLAACGLRVVEKQPGARASGEPTSPVVRQPCAGWVHVYLVEPRVRGDRCQDTAEDKRRAMHQNERRAHCQVAALSQPRVGEEERRRRRAATRSRRSGLGPARLLPRAPPVSPHTLTPVSPVVSRNAQVRRVGDIDSINIHPRSGIHARSRRTRAARASVRGTGRQPRASAALTREAEMYL